MVLRRGKRLRNDKGFTLMELLVVVGILVILALIILLILNPMTQIRKAHDSKRKADLSKLAMILEDYYNDNNCYPETDNWEAELVPDYISEMPTDAATNDFYEYYQDECDTYRIYVKLEYAQDPVIADVGCESGCGPGGGAGNGTGNGAGNGSCDYNYGICSANAELENCPSDPGALYTHGCQDIYCNDLRRCNGYTEDCYQCPRWFADDECEGLCPDHPEYHCEYIE